MARKNIAVIGGGAAGMMSAITAAKQGSCVTLYERNDRVGKKILSTGNGKCNFANMQLSAEAYFGGEKERISHVLKQFDENDVVSFFEQAGMMIKCKNDYLYPASEQASTVLDILRMQLAQYSVKILCEQKVTEIVPDKKTSTVIVRTTGSEKRYDTVVIACGGSAAPKTGSDGNGVKLAKSLGHKITPVVPALVQLRCMEDYLKAIAGVRQEAQVVLAIDDKVMAVERGEVQFTDYGISGIVVFQLSRIASYALQQKKKIKVYIDCLPDMSAEVFAEFVRKRKDSRGNVETVEEFFTGMLNKKLMMLFIKLAGLKPTEPFKTAGKDKLNKVFDLCKNFSLTINGTNSFENAQVSAGGVMLDEVSDTLESLIHKGIFFAGEILDVDGKCGGYNLQWAWSSGYVAGKNASK